jgi:hypothetical protein
MKLQVSRELKLSQSVTSPSSPQSPAKMLSNPSARCPAGFDWHRDGDGWRCNGGSHFVSNDDLPTING